MQRYKINDPPQDGITSVKFSPSRADLLVVSSWDKTTRIYNANKNQLLHKYTHTSAVLDAVLTEEDQAIFTGLEGEVRVTTMDREGNPSQLLGSHTKGAKCVRYNLKQNLLVSGSWDATIKRWDRRSENAECQTINTPGGVLAMDIAPNGSYIVAATKENKCYLYDVRKGDNYVSLYEKRNSTLAHQIRCVRCSPSSRAFVLASTEGRVSMNYYAAQEQEKKGYAFKCHRNKKNNVETLYPINAVEFHPIYHTFATGGCDGLVLMWDGVAKKKLPKTSLYPTSVASLSFNINGTLLAIASSYTWELGEKDHEKDEIFIQPVDDTTVQSYIQ